MTREVELKVLRKLAAEYRQRAATEHDMAGTLIHIAEDLEAKVREIEHAPRS